MGKKHPLISVYGNTLEEKFSLILVVGREPNDTLTMGDRVGLYDFDAHRRTGFWNIAYKVLADVEDISVRELKQECMGLRSSVLIFADISPRPILSKLQKNEIRNSVSVADYSNHIERVLSNEIIHRVGLVILSGLDNVRYKVPCDLIKEQFERLGKPAIELPFFYGTNYPKIKSMLSRKDLIVDILQEWRTAGLPYSDHTR